MVVFDNPISQLIAGKFTVSCEAGYHSDLFKNDEISVDARLDERVIRFDDLVVSKGFAR